MFREQDQLVRVFGVVGSPREGGNTDILVDEVLAGAAEAGAWTEKVLLDDIEVGYCRGCGVCQRTGECVQQDGMAALLQEMVRCQLLILGTPIYWWGPTGQFKTFLDRCYARVDDLSRTRAGRRAILILPLGDADSSLAGPAVEMLSTAVKVMAAEISQTFLVPGVFQRGAVRGRADILAQVRQAGREAVGRAWAGERGDAFQLIGRDTRAGYTHSQSTETHLGSTGG